MGIPPRKGFDVTHKIDPPDTWCVIEWPIGGPFWSVEIQDEAERTIAARTVPGPLTALEKRLIVREMFETAMSGKDRLS
jgi:hypothetical protein